MAHYGDPLSYGFGYLVYNLPNGLYSYATSKYRKGKSFNRLVGGAVDMYNRTDLDAYEWRSRHSEDWIIGKLWKKANARDLYNETVQMEADKKANTGYNWKDNAYPRSAYGSSFGNSSGYANRSPLFDVNNAILELYSGVRKW